VACDRGATGQDPVATPTPTTVGARLAWRLEPARLDLGTIDIDQRHRAELVIANAGNRALVVDKIEPSRFCSGKLQNPTIPPAMRVTLEVTCQSDLAGPLREQLTLHTNAVGATTPIDVVGHVNPRLGFDSPLIQQEMPFGETRSEETRLVGSFAARAKLALGPVENGAIEVRRIPAGAGKPEGLRLSCRGTRVGTHVGQIEVRTGLAEPSRLNLSWSCTVRGTLDVDPSNPYFNLKLSGPQFVTLEVTSRQPNFELHSVRIKQGPFRASIVTEKASGARRIRVEFADDLYREETRGANGTLVILSNDRTEPEKEVPLFGLGRRNRDGMAPHLRAGEEE
jgi:hypothetical protein